MTVHRAPSSAASTAFASASLPILSALVPFFISRAVNSGGSGPASFAKRYQYSSALKTSISASRSHTSLSATDWTRPALRPRRTLSQSSGLIL